MKKIQDLLISAVFIFVIASGALSFAILPKSDVSLSERRRLSSMPEITAAGIKDGVFFDELDGYLTDNIAMRDAYRALKARFQLYVLGIKENNSLAYRNGFIAKIQKGDVSASAENAVFHFCKIYEKYLITAETNNFISIIPDKGYFFARDFGYPSIDYDGAVKKITENMKNFDYIDIFPRLELCDYYKTDAHWSEAALEGVVSALAEKMGFCQTPVCFYEKNELYPFFGAYVGQSALAPQPDALIYLTNAALDGCVVTDIVTNERLPIYDSEKFYGRDGYELFLGGARALVKIENPCAESDRELIIFRDSFGSSVAPLLACAYRSVTLADTRYIETDKLGDYLNFDGKDVLFLYSMLTICDSRALR